MLSFHQSPKTFFVDEKLAYDPAGFGDHVFAQIRKQGIATHVLKRRISEALGVPLREIRHAGKKDAAATATQWLSWPKRAQKVSGQPADTDTYTILAYSSHTHALAIGHVKRNAFELLVRVNDRPDIEICQRRGPMFPNFFGPQRFGSGPRQWREWMAPTKASRPGKDKVSVIQAVLFNTYLHHRIETHNRMVFEDEFWMTSGGKRFFQSPLDDQIHQRFQSGEITPSGPMFGYKAPLRKDEQALLAQYGFGSEAFRQWGKSARGARRPLWAKAEPFSYHVESGHWRLKFELPAGVYATVFLLHLFSPGVLTLPFEHWPNFTEQVNWQWGDHESELAVV